MLRGRARLSRQYDLGVKRSYEQDFLVAGRNERESVCVWWDNEEAKKIIQAERQAYARTQTHARAIRVEEECNTRTRTNNNNRRGENKATSLYFAGGFFDRQ